MNVKLLKVWCVALAVLGSQACFGAPTPWVDAVVSFDQPAGSSTTGGPPSAALGAADGAFVSIDVPEILILAFTDNRVYDGPGDDLWIYEAGDCGASVDLYGRSFDGPCTYLGRITNSTGIDLADYPGLDYLDFIRFKGVEDSGQFEGYDLDACRALNSVATASPAPAPAAVLLSALGAGMVTWLRRKRIL